MKSNWIGLIFILAIFVNPAFSVAQEEPLANEESLADETKTETKKPDEDKDDPLSGAEVTIHKSEERAIEEYRVNGRLVQIKITPKHGYPYYLIDTDNDGSFDVRSSEAWSNTTVNTWKIFEW